MTIHTIFCCLGSQIHKYGYEMFYRVDYEYVLYSATLCEKFNINHFSIVTSRNSNPKSWFYYLEIKGKVEVELMKLQEQGKIETLTIVRPGMITERERGKCCGGQFWWWLPFFPKVRCFDIARCMVKEAIRVQYSDVDNNKNYRGKTHIVENAEITTIADLN